MFKNGSRRGRGRGTKPPPGPVTCDSSLWAPWGNQDSQETCVEDALRFCCRWRPRALLLPCVLWHPEQGAGSGVLTSHDVRKTVLPGQGQLISSANTKWSWGPTFPTGKGTTLPGLPLSSLRPRHVPARHMEEHWPPRGQRLPSSHCLTGEDACPCRKVSSCHV